MTHGFPLPPYCMSAPPLGPLVEPWRLRYAAYALQGRLAEGCTLPKETIRKEIRTGALRYRSHQVVWLSEICGLAGHGEEAWQHAHQALDLARQGDMVAPCAGASTHLPGTQVLI